ncbi:MAG: hypothetical protein ABIS67_11265 [Candidatus Eisenbacteria bacterium]
MRRLLRAVPAVLLLVSLATLVTARRGQSVPLYAARTGLMCQNCHFDPNGGGTRNEFGFAFAKNRHAVEPEGEGSPWKDLALTNRVGDNFPLYVGINHRFMAIANTTAQSDSLDRAGFYNMENALHLTFQPHPRLTLVYTRDGFDGGSSSKEAFGMIGGFPVGGYLKAGRFRTPFGVRFDDHTVATRNGFLDFFAPTTFSVGYQDSVKSEFLPYDPRRSDMGLEYGVDWNGAFARASRTNGDSHPLFGSGNLYASTTTLKLGYNRPGYQGAISIYDEFRRFEPSASPTERKRATRWAYSGLVGHGPVALLGEVSAGTDETVPVILGHASGPKTNSLAWWAEVDYAPVRQANVRLRYDRMNLDRGAMDPYIREINQHSRMALEAEWVPVPFAELRWTLRKIDHDGDNFRNDFFGGKTPIEDEMQTYLQFHFSY